MRDRWQILVRHPGFVRLWIADGLSNFGTAISTLALQLLMIDVLSADQVDIGLMRAAQWSPCLLFGLVVGVFSDRLKKKRILMVADVVSASALFLIASLAIVGWLSVPVLTGLVFIVGSAAVFQGGTHQSFTADLLPASLLTAGNVKLSQTWTASQTLGPLVSGMLVRAIGAPFAIVVDASTFALSALLLSTIEAEDKTRATRSFTVDLREGLAFIYRHPTLSPYALTLHLWFVGSGIAGTVYVYHASTLGLRGASIGITLACAGIAGLLGSAAAERVSLMFGLGKAVAASDLLSGGAWAIAASSPSGTGALVVLCVAQSCFGFGLGLRGPLESSYRNAVTPTTLRGRMNTTIRSINWGLIAIAAPLGGWLALREGNSAALLAAASIMSGSGIALMASRYRCAVMPSADIG